MKSANLINELQSQVIDSLEDDLPVVNILQKASQDLERVQCAQSQTPSKYILKPAVTAAGYPCTRFLS